MTTGDREKAADPILHGVRGEEGGGTSICFLVTDMDCPSCVQKIEGHLRNVEGILAVRGSPVARTLTVELLPEVVDSTQVSEEIGRLGYVPHLLDGDGPGPQNVRTWTSRQARIAYVSIGLFSLGLLLRLAGVVPQVVSFPLHDIHLPDVFYLGSALVGGWNFFPKGIRAARLLSLDMNFLMTVAILGAVGIGEYMEAAAIAFLFALAELLENYSVDRARRSVEALLELAPDTAQVIRSGQEVAVPTEELLVGDEMIVRPGERIGADGIVEDGASAVDQSTITGESLPVEKTPGEEVYSGTINRDGFLRVRVNRPASESALARIVRLVEEAEAEKSHTERFVERFARYYTPAVTVGAVLVVAVPTLLLGAPFVPWFVRGLTLLVIACPCALVISTPVTVVSGVTAAARNGVLIKGGLYLESMGSVKALAIDKTGTLTQGHPKVVSVRPLDGMAEEEVLARAAAVESRSEHPVGRAIVEAARDAGIDAKGFILTDFRSEPGKGARATLAGEEHVVGKPSFVCEGGNRVAPPLEFTQMGRTVVGLSRNGELVAWIALADQPRANAKEAVADLLKAGIRQVVMVTGDNQATAEAVGREVGVSEIRAGLLPEDKVKVIRGLGSEFGSVAMVGDGVNDGPALAVASVGIAMGAAGSDIALETADIALMGDNLARLPYLYTLSRRARQVIRQNIVVAIAVKGILVIGVPLGLVPLVAAVVIGDMGVSLAVTLNALRLAHLRP